MQTQGHGAPSPQCVGTSGQLGKEQTLPCAEDLFSWYGVGLGQPDTLSQQPALPGKWRLHPHVVQLIWGLFKAAQVDLFASSDSTHCQLFYSLTEGTLCTDALAHSWHQGLRKYAFPPVSLLAQTLCKVREDEEQVQLVAPYWPSRTWFSELMLLMTAPPWPIPLRKDLLSQRRGSLWHSHPDLWKLHVWSLVGTQRERRRTSRRHSRCTSAVRPSH